MNKIAFLNILFCSFLLMVGANVNAQNSDIKNAIKNNPDSCLGEQIAYKNYPFDVMQIIQKNLEDIYKDDVEWKDDSAKHGQPLHDGKMGPVTWSWMQRFCNNFATRNNQNMGKEFPGKVARMADFATRYTDDIAILISDDFTDWIKAQKDPTQKENYAVLYQGSDDELFALIARYKDRNKPVAVAPEIKKITEPVTRNTFYLYSLTQQDFAKLQSPDVQPLLAPLVDKPFNDEIELDTAIAAVFKDQPAELKQHAMKAISTAVTRNTSYQLNEKILENLANAGLNALQIAALNKLPKNVSESEADFTKKVTTALDSAMSADAGNDEKKDDDKTNDAKNSDVKNSSDQNADAIKTSSAKNPDEQAAANELALIRVLNASRKSTLSLTQANAVLVNSQLSQHQAVVTLPASVIDLLASIADIEYPDGELLHSAARNNFQKGLASCLLNRVKAVDTQVKPLGEQARNNLLDIFKNSTNKESIKEALNTIFSRQLNDAQQIEVCNEAYDKDMAAVYDALIRPAINRVYRKVAPAYNPKKIQWEGNKCGCVPTASASTAYGFYRYWDVSDQEQSFDFSTFSRVGYYGFSFNSNGQITQTNTNDQSKSLVNDKTGDNNLFINVARNYGAKVDWVLEKDWNEELTGNESADIKKINATLDALRENILALLREPLNDPLSVVKPFLSLGLSNHPHKGDGVTLYFKHYPDSIEGKAVFNHFFKTLKDELDVLTKENNRFTIQGESYYLNIVSSQADFQSEEGVLGNANLKQLIGIKDNKIINMTPLEMQNKVKTLFLVLLNDPYYNSLDEIYAMSSEANRDIVLPVLFMNYKVFHSADENITVYERQKNLAYIQESFGGGGFWSMPTWDKKGAEDFNHHLATQFALGYPQSWWTEKFCGYRWTIISVMNVWLCLALIIIILAFYVFPQQCRELPAYLNIALHPAAVIILVAPPFIIWITLLIVDHHFPFICWPSVLALILIGLTLWAGVKYIKSLRQRKPNRNLLQAQKIPSRAQLGVPKKTS